MIIPVTLAKIITETKKCFPFLKTPLYHFNNHIMEIVNALLSDDLKENIRVSPKPIISSYP